MNLCLMNWQPLTFQSFSACWKAFYEYSFSLYSFASSQICFENGAIRLPITTPDLRDTKASFMLSFSVIFSNLLALLAIKDQLCGRPQTQ